MAVDWNNLPLKFSYGNNFVNKIKNQNKIENGVIYFDSNFKQIIVGDGNTDNDKTHYKVYSDLYQTLFLGKARWNNNKKQYELLIYIDEPSQTFLSSANASLIAIRVTFINEPTETEDIYNDSNKNFIIFTANDLLNMTPSISINQWQNAGLANQYNNSINNDLYITAASSIIDYRKTNMIVDFAYVPGTTPQLIQLGINLSNKILQYTPKLKTVYTKNNNQHTIISESNLNKRFGENGDLLHLVSYGATYEGVASSTNGTYNTGPTGAPPTNSNILVMNWDNGDGIYDSQLAIANTNPNSTTNKNQRIYFRSSPGNAASWRELTHINAGEQTGAGNTPVYIDNVGKVLPINYSLNATINQGITNTLATYSNDSTIKDSRLVVDIDSAYFANLGRTSQDTADDEEFRRAFLKKIKTDYNALKGYLYLGRYRPNSQGFFIGYSYNNDGQINGTNDPTQPNHSIFLKFNTHEKTPLIFGTYTPNIENPTTEYYEYKIFTNSMNLIPISNNSYNIGNADFKWNNIYATKFIGNADSATALKTARTFKVDLTKTTASTGFDGTANIADIGVSGILSIANGGTGESTPFAAITALGGPSIADKGIQLKNSSRTLNIDELTTGYGTYYSSNSEETAQLSGVQPFSTGYKLYNIHNYSSTYDFQMALTSSSNSDVINFKMRQKYKPTNATDSWGNWKQIAFTDTFNNNFNSINNTISTINDAISTINNKFDTLYNNRLVWIKNNKIYAGYHYADEHHISINATGLNQIDETNAYNFYVNGTSKLGKYISIGNSDSSDSAKTIASSSSLYLMTSDAASIILGTNGIRQVQLEKNTNTLRPYSLTELMDLGTSTYKWNNAYINNITVTNDITATNFIGTLDGNTKSITVYSQYTANYPWHRIASFSKSVAINENIDAIIEIYGSFNNSPIGKAKITYRTYNNNSKTNEGSIHWITRQGFDVEDLQMSYYNVGGGAVWADVFLKKGTWAATRIYCTTNQGWTFIDSSEYSTDNGASASPRYTTKSHQECYTDVQNALSLHGEQENVTIVSATDYEDSLYQLKSTSSQWRKILLYANYTEDAFATIENKIQGNLYASENISIQPSTGAIKTKGDIRAEGRFFGKGVSYFRSTNAIRGQASNSVSDSTGLILADANGSLDNVGRLGSLTAFVSKTGATHIQLRAYDPTTTDSGITNPTGSKSIRLIYAKNQKISFCPASNQDIDLGYDSGTDKYYWKNIYAQQGIIDTAPTENKHIATKQYVDQEVSKINAQVINGILTFNFNISN